MVQCAGLFLKNVLVSFKLRISTNSIRNSPFLFIRLFEYLSVVLERSADNLLGYFVFALKSPPIIRHSFSLVVLITSARLS